MALTPESEPERLVGFEPLYEGNPGDQRILDDITQRSDAESLAGEMEPWSVSALVPANFNGVIHTETPKFSYMLRSYTIMATGTAFVAYQAVAAVGYEPNTTIMGTVFSKKATLLRAVFNGHTVTSAQLSHTFTPGRGLVIPAGKGLNFLFAGNGPAIYSTMLSFVLYVERIKGVK